MDQQSEILVTRQSLTPILGRIDKQVRSFLCKGPLKDDVHQPRVIQHATDPGVVLSYGLCPYNRLYQWVLVLDGWSPTGFGTRSLSQQELGDLWDIPIIMKYLTVTDRSFDTSTKVLIFSPQRRGLTGGGLVTGGVALVASNSV